MISMICIEANLDPTIHIGGELDAIGGNTRIGKGPYFIAEACEYVESFLKLYPFLGVISNIEEDHLDYYRDIQHIKEAFLKFGNLIPRNGYMVGCADDKNVLDVMEKLDCNKVTYGLYNNAAHWKAANIIWDSMGCASFDACGPDMTVPGIKLNIPGIHNIKNSLAAIASCIALG